MCVYTYDTYSRVLILWCLSTLGENADRSYERHAILEWFEACRRDSRSPTSPMTGEAMGSEGVTSNHALKGRIQVTSIVARGSRGSSLLPLWPARAGVHAHSFRHVLFFFFVSRHGRERG